MRCTPMMYMPMRCTLVRCTFMRYTQMRCTPGVHAQKRQSPLRGKAQNAGNLPHLGRKLPSNNISAVSKSDYFCFPGLHARREVFSLTLRLAFFIMDERSWPSLLFSSYPG